MNTVIDQRWRDDQRLRLTKANFNMGKTPNFYNTNNKLAFYPMRGNAASVDERTKVVDANRKTNFIA